jgi:hypothetical protein
MDIVWCNGEVLDCQMQVQRFDFGELTSCKNAEGLNHIQDIVLGPHFGGINTG